MPSGSGWQGLVAVGECVGVAVAVAVAVGSGVGVGGGVLSADPAAVSPQPASRTRPVSMAMAMKTRTRRFRGTFWHFRPAGACSPIESPISLLQTSVATTSKVASRAATVAHDGLAECDAAHTYTNASSWVCRRCLRNGVAEPQPADLGDLCQRSRDLLLACVRHALR